MTSNRDYIVLRRTRDHSGYFELTSSDPYDDRIVKNHDQILALSGEIFEECGFSSGQILKKTKLSPLWITVLSCYQESAELLVRSGADVNERYGLPEGRLDLKEKSSLLHALLQMYPSAWNERFIGLVMDHGADLTARDYHGSTVLHLAVRNGRVQVAQTLLERGVDVDAVRCGGMTPFLEAAHTSEIDQLLPLLIKYGADVTARDELGRNVLYHLAVANGGENVDMARVLIEKGVSPRETVDSDQYQPIHAAVLRGKNALVNLFLDHGANVNARKQGTGESPLFLACRQLCENPAVLLTLLKRGANIDLKTNSGFTALYDLTLHRSVCWSDGNTVKKLKILLSAGVDMFAAPDDVHGLVGDMTPFEVICHRNMYNPSIELILKTLALRKQPLTESRDERIVKNYPQLWNRYRDCVEEIDGIKAAKLIKSGAFFELLTKCQCQVVPLMRHCEFESKFRLFDRSVFPMYADEVLEAFERAKGHYQSILDQEDLVNEAVHNVLPYMVVRKVARYSLDCEACETKKTVHASRGIV